MGSWTDRDVGENYKAFAIHLKGEIDKMNDISTLPLFGARQEIAARQKAVAILRPILDSFVTGAAQYLREQPMQEDEDRPVYWG
jgi:hypothetical protein